MQPYSPERRTALVLCGTGAHGAYHAGVLRALREAGVKLDVVAGHGIGAGAAALAAIDGAARLWDAGGIWRGPAVATLYRWQRSVLVVAALVTAAVVVALAAPLIAWASSPSAAVRVSALAAILAVVVGGAVVLQRRRGRPTRRAAGAWWWRIFGAPFDASGARQIFTRVLGELIPGESSPAGEAGASLGRRYSEVLADSLGQPGFRELMLVATDLDSRRDIVAALLREPYRREFLARHADRNQRAEIIDLAGSGREHALDVVAAALTPPVLCDPHLLSFASDSYWRGETHRLCDRPGAVSRLLEELAAAGVTQAIVVSAVPAPGEPHRLSATRRDVRHRLGDFLAAAEAAALRDAFEMARLRFDSVYLICPAHNAIGAFDFAGSYDEASDRRQDLAELMDRAYDDAYRRFIEPVVGASGEHLAREQSGEEPQHLIRDREPI